MGENTNILWTNHTFNAWIGCDEVAPECDNCYARELAKFRGWAKWGPLEDRHRTSISNWKKPIKWNKEAPEFIAEHGHRPRVFCSSLADVFDNKVDRRWRVELFQLIKDTPLLDWQLLTKRPQNMTGMLPDDWGSGWPNVWIGTSAGCQKTADIMIPALIKIPAVVRFVSCEPMLGPVNLRGGSYGPDWLEGWDVEPDCCGRLDQDGFCCGEPDPMQVQTNKIDWIICGGESGTKRRPMSPEWAQSIRDDCQSTEVPFFFKQWGGRFPGSGGNLLDGKKHLEMPESIGL